MDLIKIQCFRKLYPVLCGDLNGKEIQKRGDRYMYINGWFTLLYNIGKQLYSNKNQNK